MTGYVDDGKDGTGLDADRSPRLRRHNYAHITVSPMSLARPMSAVSCVRGAGGCAGPRYSPPGYEVWPNPMAYWHRFFVGSRRTERRISGSLDVHVGNGGD